MVKLIKGNGRFDFGIVGESYRQNNLGLLAGPKVSGGYDLDCLAVLGFDDDNEFDANAVAVFICLKTGDVKLVGYLSRSMARAYRKAVADTGGQDPEGMLCRAKIIGGWDNDDADDGMYGVTLDLMLPLTFAAEHSIESWSKRLL